MSIYERRWNAVESFINTRLIPAMKQPGVVALFEGREIAPIQIQLYKNDRVVDVLMDHASYNIFDGNPGIDHGAHETIESTIERLKQTFLLYKKVDY